MKNTGRKIAKTIQFSAKLVDIRGGVKVIPVILFLN